jgi:hypothetical protein
MHEVLLRRRYAVKKKTLPLSRPLGVRSSSRLVRITKYSNMIVHHVALIILNYFGPVELT